MSRADVTRDAFPLHFAIADAFGGTVEPFDVYQGPYVVTKGGARLWIMYADSGDATVWDEVSGCESDEFWPHADDAADWAVSCARSIVAA